MMLDIILFRKKKKFLDLCHQCLQSGFVYGICCPSIISRSFEYNSWSLSSRSLGICRNVCALVRSASSVSFAWRIRAMFFRSSFLIFTILKRIATPTTRARTVAYFICRLRISLWCSLIEIVDEHEASGRLSSPLLQAMTSVTDNNIMYGMNFFIS